MIGRVEEGMIWRIRDKVIETSIEVGQIVSYQFRIQSVNWMNNVIN